MSGAAQSVLLAWLLALASSQRQGPCDIYAQGSTPCVAAHSLTRSLYGAYTGPLYQVKRESDGATQDISVLPSAGVADSTLQDSFCQEDSCTVSRIYDQSPNQNHLDIGPGGGNQPVPDKGVNATANRVFVWDASAKKLHPVYGARFDGGMGYRNDKTKGVAVGEEPESMYMVIAGKHYNDKCCFDYGNAETDNDDDGAGTMEAVYWGSRKKDTRGSHGAENGPWVMADLENGLWAGVQRENPGNTPISTDFVTAFLKGDANRFALKHADATAQSPEMWKEQSQLKTLYDGKRPPKYEIMKKQGAIVLGIGGDNSNWAVGTFYEGVMTHGFADNKVDDEVQMNILQAGYQVSNSRAGHDVADVTFV